VKGARPPKPAPVSAPVDKISAKPDSDSE